MKKEVFNQIVVDNIDATLVSVVLSNGMKLSKDLLIEGNKTTTTNVTFIKIEDNYVAVRRRMDVSYDYSGQTRQGDSEYADFYMGYEDIAALEFYEEAVKQALDEKAKAEAAPLMNEVQEEYVQKAKKINEEESLFLKTAGDI
nr:hypothetical protein [Lachnospiraceae bacterium]